MRNNCELEKQLQEERRDQVKEPQHLEAVGSKVDKRDTIKLRWRDGGRASFASNRWRDAIVDGNRVYFLDGNCQLWTYDINGKRWSRLSEAPCSSSGFVILDGLPTTVGGVDTNKLMSLTVKRKWVEKFPPMPTERKLVTATCTRAHLIVAGGIGRDVKLLSTVEVLNIENCQWSTAVDQPEPLQYHSVTVCDDQLYMLGGARGYSPTKSGYTCSVSALLQTCTQRSVVGTLKRALSLSNSSSSSGGVWSKLPDLPVTRSTCVTFCGQLLAIGGEDSDKKPTTAVYMYNQATNSWNVISHMSTARSRCFAAVLPDNQLMVVGGRTEIHYKWTYLDLVEFGNLC